MIKFSIYLIFDNAILIDISNQLNINNLTVEKFLLRSDKLIWDRLYFTVSGITTKNDFFKEC